MKKFLLLGFVMLAFVACGGGSDTPADDGADETTTGGGTSTVATEAAVRASVDATMSNTDGFMPNPSTSKSSKVAHAITPYTYDCAGAGEVAWIGTYYDVFFDWEGVDNQSDLLRLDAAMDLEGDFTGCSLDDDTTTTDFDESQIILDGLINAVTDVSVDFQSATFDLSVSVNGEMEISGDECPGGGTLSLALTVPVHGSIPAEGEDPDLSDFNCTVSGEATGDVCGTTVDCTISGDCTNPTVAGTGCE